MWPVDVEEGTTKVTKLSSHIPFYGSEPHLSESLNLPNCGVGFDTPDLLGQTIEKAFIK
jgi:hypothetical protein